MSVLDFLGLGSKSKRGQRADRQTAVGSVKVDKFTYPIENRSATGLLVSGHDGQLAKGQRCQISVSVQTSNGPLDFSCQAIVARLAGDKLAFHFDRLNKAYKAAILRHFQQATANQGRRLAG